ncbi:DNA-binding GntR family transcriptional regulator [Humitalea rosea]|uniref:DNA-binding GntR family transcriptional regulator n=1 Tax=Humitalea rosea TaxID=990373 RepID=A0A2W7JS00_9PROT|nr:FCD domain-containing protein [Humitalea rosea]PZW37706.1 DNA-binding GntR family transcriptional regulator [Humitalea rosea]
MLTQPPRRRRAPEALGIDVARRIEQLITQGVLTPGERLNEVALARNLGVSRGPVREAARALEKTGLVTVIMNRGAFVRSLGLDEAMEIYEINAVLFGLASSRAAQSLTAAQAFELRDMVEAMDQAILTDHRERFFEINSGFHAFIFACGRNAEAASLYAGYTRKLMLLRRRSFERPGHMAEANCEHRALMEAMLAGDGARARLLAEAHARLGRARFLDSIGHAAETRAHPASAGKSKTIAKGEDAA